MSRKEALAKIIQLISDDRLEKAIDALLSGEVELRADARTEVRLLKGRLTELKRQQNAGTISPADFNLEWSRIRMGLLEVVEKEERREVSRSGEEERREVPEGGRKPWIRLGLLVSLLIGGIVLAVLFLRGCSDTCSQEDRDKIKIRVARFGAESDETFSKHLVTEIEREFKDETSVMPDPIRECLGCAIDGQHKVDSILNEDCFFNGMVVWGSLDPLHNQSEDSLFYTCYIDVNKFDTLPWDASDNMIETELRHSIPEFKVWSKETASLVRLVAAEIFCLKGDYFKALACLKSIKGTHSTFQGRIHAGRGRSYRNLDSIPEAIREYREAVRLNPEDLVSKQALGELGDGEITDSKPPERIDDWYTGKDYFPSNRVKKRSDTLSNDDRGDSLGNGSEEQALDTLHPLIAALQRNMVTVPGGSFMMGCTEEQDSCGESEEPVHPVNVQSFQINRYEVTQEEWSAVMGKYPESLNFSGCDKCPVEGVSWYDVQEFLDSLNQKTGMRYRLPSEAEWEFAAREGKDGGTSYSGGEDLNDVGWFWENSEYKTHPVGRKKGNSLGLFDMSGNVFELCEDNWHSDYVGAPADGSPWIDSGHLRVLRGGAWDYDPRFCRVACRGNWIPDDRNGGVGFRLAHSL